MMNCAGVVTINRKAVSVLSVIAIFLIAYYGMGTSVHENQLDSQIFEYVDLKNLLGASIDAAQRGGLKVYKIRESASLQEKSKGKTSEGANDPVTEGDMMSHVEMFYSLKKTFPKLNIISEEKPTSHYDTTFVKEANINVGELLGVNIQSELVNSKDIQIWIDPLDATQEYTEDLRQYVTTMVCVAVKGIPVIGVIHKPFENFTAWAFVKNVHSPSLNIVNLNKIGWPQLSLGWSGSKMSHCLRSSLG